GDGPGDESETGETQPQVEPAAVWQNLRRDRLGLESLLAGRGSRRPLIHDATAVPEELPRVAGDRAAAADSPAFDQESAARPFDHRVDRELAEQRFREGVGDRPALEPHLAGAGGRSQHHASGPAGEVDRLYDLDDAEGSQVALEAAGTRVGHHGP